MPFGDLGPGIVVTSAAHGEVVGEDESTGELPRYTCPVSTRLPVDPFFDGDRGGREEILANACPHRIDGLVTHVEATGDEHSCVFGFALRGCSGCGAGRVLRWRDGLRQLDDQREHRCGHLRPAL